MRSTVKLRACSRWSGADDWRCRSLLRGAVVSVVTPREPAARVTAREHFATSEQALHVGRLSRLLVAAASSAGKRHVVNEDSYSSPASDVPVFVVADGVGGGAMAAWASRHVVTCVQRMLARRRIDADAVRAALFAADGDVARGIARRTTRTGAATVALCAKARGFRSRWLIGWVGDCRIYRVSNAGIPSVDLLTRDDTYRNLGEAPPPGGSPDDPARMVGNGAVDAPNVAQMELRNGESLVLCTDGVYKHVSEREIADALSAETPLAQRCLRLIELARTNGSADDATALVVRGDAAVRTRSWRLACAYLLAVLLTAVVVVLASDAEASLQAQPVTPFQFTKQAESGP